MQENGSLLFSAVEKQDEAEYRCKVVKMIMGVIMIMIIIMIMMVMKMMMIPQAKNMYGMVQSPPARLRVEAGEAKVMIVINILISTIINFITIMINTMIIRSVNP